MKKRPAGFNLGVLWIYLFNIFLAGLRPRPLGRKERTLWPEAKGFLVRGLGRGAKSFPIRVHAKRESLLLTVF